MKGKCRKHIHDQLKPALEERFRHALPSGLDWALTVANTDEDPEQQTLLFRYPSVVGASSAYVSRKVKIELGARSDTEPSEMPEIRSYVAEEFPSLFTSGAFAIHTVSPRRTFWEKTMLLHEENSRPAGKPPKQRLSRHYYDLWCLIRKGIAAEAMADCALFAQVLAHRNVFFRQSWVDYDTITPRALRLTPQADWISAWQGDYESMRREMFFGMPPTFGEVLAAIGELETALRQLG